MAITLFPAPPPDPTKSLIENALELTPVADIGPDVFTNTRPLWHPPGARGIYGGAAIAQCLSAAQKTVPPNFLPHSMHCYFVLAGDAQLPILYHVERVRDGKSYATRTVQARQQGRPIFTTTLSFDRVGNGGQDLLTHSGQMPKVSLPEPNGTNWDHKGPFETRRIGIAYADRPAAERSLHQFVRARGKISPEGGRHAHLTALAYMSDSMFIGTVSSVQGIPRFSSRRAFKTAISDLNNPSDLEAQSIKYLNDLVEVEAKTLQENGVTPPPGPKNEKPEVTMMVSLDHTIYFHDRSVFGADDWIFTDMSSPWAGEGRGFVAQKMWTRDGRLIATCVQEGVVRLKQHSKPEPSGASKL
ncbi:hypothetical protein FQN57_001812 [Myotisia sp. PD_48]|nr:hypothetical protein FQN57_001812 [Myotisia sp. PD_48]